MAASTVDSLLKRKSAMPWHEALPQDALDTNAGLHGAMQRLITDALLWAGRLAPRASREQLQAAWQAIHCNDPCMHAQLFSSQGRVLGHGAQGHVQEVQLEGQEQVLKVTPALQPQECVPGNPLFSCTVAEVGVAVLFQLARTYQQQQYQQGQQQQQHQQQDQNEPLVAPAVLDMLSHLVESRLVVLQPVRLKPGTRQGGLEVQLGARHPHTGLPTQQQQEQQQQHQQQPQGPRVALRVGLVMERCDCDLRHIIAGLHAARCDGGMGLRPVDLAVVLDLGRQLFTALSGLHAILLVHGDVKPANLLIQQVQPRTPSGSDNGGHSFRPCTYRLKLGDLGTLDWQGSPTPTLYTKQFCCISRLRGLSRGRHARASSGATSAGADMVHDVYAGALCVLEMLLHSSHWEGLRADPIAWWQGALAALETPIPLAARELASHAAELHAACEELATMMAASPASLVTPVPAPPKGIDAAQQACPAQPAGNPAAAAADSACVPRSTSQLRASQRRISQESYMWPDRMGAPDDGHAACSGLASTMAGLPLHDVLLAGGSSWHHLHVLLPRRRQVLGGQACGGIVEQLLMVLASCMGQPPESRPPAHVIAMHLAALQQRLGGVVAGGGPEAGLLMLDDLNFPFVAAPSMSKSEYLQRLAACRARSRLLPSTSGPGADTSAAHHANNAHPHAAADMQKRQAGAPGRTCRSASAEATTAQHLGGSTPPRHAGAAAAAAARSSNSGGNSSGAHGQLHGSWHGYQPGHVAVAPTASIPLPAGQMTQVYPQQSAAGAVTSVGVAGPAEPAWPTAPGAQRPASVYPYVLDVHGWTSVVGAQQAHAGAAALTLQGAPQQPPPQGPVSMEQQGPGAANADCSGAAAAAGAEAAASAERSSSLARLLSAFGLRRMAERGYEGTAHPTPPPLPQQQLPQQQHQQQQQQQQGQGQEARTAAPFAASPFAAPAPPALVLHTQCGAVHEVSGGCAVGVPGLLPAVPYMLATASSCGSPGTTSGRSSRSSRPSWSSWLTGSTRSSSTSSSSTLTASRNSPAGLALSADRLSGTADRATFTGRSSQRNCGSRRLSLNWGQGAGSGGGKPSGFELPLSPMGTHALNERLACVEEGPDGCGPSPSPTDMVRGRPADAPGRPAGAPGRPAGRAQLLGQPAKLSGAQGLLPVWDGDGAGEWCVGAGRPSCDQGGQSASGCTTAHKQPGARAKAGQAGVAATGVGHNGGPAMGHVVSQSAQAGGSSSGGRPRVHWWCGCGGGWA